MVFLGNKEKLKESVDKIREKYPDRVPVLLKEERMINILKDLTQKKFIVPEDITISQFMGILRGRIELLSEWRCFYL